MTTKTAHARDYSDALARVDSAAKLVHPPARAADSAQPHPIRARAGAIVVHQAWTPNRTYSCTVPCGASLGTYRTLANARAAAAILAPLVINPAGEDLAQLFGSVEAARNAHAAVRHLTAF